MAPGIGLPDFNATNVWAAPGVAINSTEAFNHASRLQNIAYVANRWLFVAIMIVLICFIAISFPPTLSRLRYSSHWYNGFRISFIKSSSTPDIPTARVIPKPMRTLKNPLSPRTIPYFNLTYFQVTVVLVLWIVSCGLAGWCQSAFLTHASSATLIIMGLAALGAALGIKSGGVGTWISTGYTAVNFLHRWTGRLVLLLSILHVVAYLVVFYKDGIAKEEMAKPENYLAAIAFAGLCLAGVGSIRPIRNSSWILFKFSHHIGILLFLAGLNYHSPNILPYLIAIWILLAWNTIIRSITTRFPIVELEALPNSSSTILTTSLLSKGFFPGQHVRVRCVSGLGISNILESHPFTIASTPGERLECIIKSSGDWTDRLHQAALQNRKIRCSIEGPYGGPINFMLHAYESALIVVGGSGISFGMGLSRGVLSEVIYKRSPCTRLNLVWAVRTMGELDDMSSRLVELVSKSKACAQLEFRISLFVTGRKPEAAVETVKSTTETEKVVETNWSDDEHIQISWGRPDPVDLLADLVTRSGKGGVGIVTCGPTPLVEAVELAARGVDKQEKKRVGGVEVYAEKFSL